jgi:hypothetical protein
MLISYCVPCHNRTYDLKKTLPLAIQAANESPPVEIVVLNYNSQDDLDDYMLDDLHDGDCHLLSYKKYTARDYYHMAHARNLSVLASKGEFIVVSSADVLISDNYFVAMRDALEEDDYVWIRHSNRFVGIIGVKRTEFIEAGGFDERFEFYGKEDKDLKLRLERRGGIVKILPDTFLSLIPTLKEDKFKNYRLKLSRKQMGNRAKKIYEENIKNEVLVVNKDGWGAWD